jgi:hypothetical protein
VDRRVARQVEAAEDVTDVGILASSAKNSAPKVKTCQWGSAQVRTHCASPPGDELHDRRALLPAKGEAL